MGFDVGLGIWGEIEARILCKSDIAELKQPGMATQKGLYQKYYLLCTLCHGSKYLGEMVQWLPTALGCSYIHGRYHPNNAVSGSGIGLGGRRIQSMQFGNLLDERNK